MIENLISSTGGLHNRLTNIIRLEPFTLAEARDFLDYKKITLDAHQLVQLYMVTGGVPLYLDHVEKGLSAIQNIEHLSFQVDGLLFNEFKQLFASLFSNCTVYEELIRIIAGKRYGIG